MKKLFACLAIILALSLVLSACNKNKDGSSTVAPETTDKVIDSVVDPEDNTSAAPETTVAPETTETEAPTTSATEDPTTSETEAPTTSETEAPTTSETEAPTTSETEAPTTSETEVPTTSETEEPTTSETEEPTTDGPHDCADGDNDHNCDTCGEKVSDCADADYNGKCDVCGADCPIPGLSGTAGMHSPDTYRENGVVMVDGNADQWFAANRANDGISGVDTIGFRGWAFIGDGKTVAVADFGYGFKQVEGITWGFAPIVDENLYAPLEGRTEVRRYDITIDLTVLEETGEYDVILYVKDADGKVYTLDRWVDVWVNYVNTYEQNSASSTAQSDIDLGYGGSILTESGFAFDVLTEGSGVAANNPGLITEKNGTAVWQISGGFGEWFTTTTGKYAYNVDFYSANGAAGAFIRGAKAGFTGWDPNYYGAVGNGQNIHQSVAFGKAGIYYYVQNGHLVLTVVSWTGSEPMPNDVTRVIIPGCEGSTTAIDLGDVIYFKTGKYTVAKVELSGSAKYGDIEAAMCESAKITTWDGQVVEIAQPLITADYAGINIGLAERVGAMDIKAVSYGSAKGVSYNAALDTVVSIATDKVIYSEGEKVVVAASNGNKSYICAYKAGTTELIDSYEMGTKDGFENLKAGEYDIVLVDYADSSIRYRSVTIKINPAGLVSTYGPSDFMARPNTPFGSTFGTTLALSEDGSYVTLTVDDSVQATDYNWYFCFGLPGYEIAGSNYMVVKYRTTATNIDRHEAFIATGTIAFGGAGSNINFTDRVICDGEWRYLYINFEDYGVRDMNSCAALRFDFINGAPSGSTIDIEFINFYATADAAWSVANAHDCADTDNNHECDKCGEKLSDCVNENGDHNCDICGKALTECADSDRDHNCDVCGNKVSDCADNDGDHLCDVCDKKASDCADADNNFKCDVCGAPYYYDSIETLGHMSADTYYENGITMKDGEAAAWIAQNRVDGITGVDNIGFRGWAFLNDKTPIAAYGYAIGNGAIVWNGEVQDAPEVGTVMNNDSVKRFVITVDLTNVEPGDYSVVTYVKFTDGRVFELSLWGDITVTIPDGPAADSELTLEEAIAHATAQGSGNYTTDKYYITVTIKDVYNTQYGNMNVVDDNGNEFTVYGTYSADGSTRYDAMTSKPIAGDTVTVYGVLGMYNTTPQMKNGWITSFTHNHKFSEATCTDPATCACGAVGEDATGHTYENGTCKDCGAIDPDAVVGGDTTPVTASKTVKDLIKEYGWTQNTTKQTFKLDDIVTVKINGGSNTGKAYNGDHIRIYATDSPAGTITISVPDGYELVTIKITTVTGTYAFLRVDGTTTDISNKTVEVSGNSVKLNSVKNGSDGKQVRVMAMEVVYKLIGSDDTHECADVNPADHKCDTCNEVLSECADNNNDHHCDVCGAELSECADTDKNHKCDTCDATLSECADANKDHKCDVCEATLSECADANPADHKCDVCGTVTSECGADTDNNNKCDVCGKELPAKPLVFDEVSDYAYGDYQSCSPANGNFAPIYNAIQSQNPGVEMKDQYAAISGGAMIWLGNGDHPVDLSKYSKMIITFTCDRTNTIDKFNANAGNNKFELLSFTVAPLAVGEYTLPSGDWVLNTCEIDLTGVDHNGEVLLRMYNGGLANTWYVVYSVVLVPYEETEDTHECADTDNNHKCDTCEAVLSECADTDKNHKCDVCDATLSECADVDPADHNCDVCGAVTSECGADTDSDNKCDVCGKELASDAPDTPDAPVVGGGSADFDTIVTKDSFGDSSYTNTYTTTDGWVVSNSAIQSGGIANNNPQFTVIGPDNTHRAPCLNGKVSAPGKVESPVLSGGISKLTIKYTKMFTDTKLGVTITITDIATGEKYTHVISVELDKNEKYVEYTDEWVLETPISGDFTIEIVNNCPSANTGNKDRMTILSIDWAGYAGSGSSEPETPDAPDTHECADADNNHKCDVCDATLSECADADKNHKCDTCDATLSECADADKNHKCDTCDATLSECADTDKNHKCDTCDATLSECADTDKNHKCDTCDATLSECADTDKNHKCDTCDATLSECADADKNHKCDTCDATLSECADADKNHKCDTCDATLSECADTDKNHKCDVCDTVVSACADENKDHKCDTCEATLTECADDDKNHACDVCGAETSKCEAAEGSHNCAVCGAVKSECVAAEGSHNCAICGAKKSDCADTNNDHNCDTCGAKVSDCADTNKDHHCDACGAETSKCADANNDHNCDTCGAKVSDCGDNNKDHKCDVCGAKLSDCADNDGNYYCDTCGKTMPEYAGPKFKLDSGWLAKATYDASYKVTKVEGDDYTYVTLTTATPANPGDYNWTVITNKEMLPTGYNNIRLSTTTIANNVTRYFAIRYRTTVQGTTNEWFIHTPKHNLGSPTAMGRFNIVADGQWHTAFIDLASAGVTDITALKYLRLDLLNNAPAGSTMDIAWVGFFYTSEAVTEYNETSVNLWNVTEFIGPIGKVNANTANYGPIFSATGEKDSRGLPMLYMGSFKVGNYDLSKYSKMIITYATDHDNSGDMYNASAKTFAITNGSSVIATGTYTLSSKNWAWTTMEIDLTNVNYSGDVYVTVSEFLTGSVVIYKNVTFVE